MSRNLSVLFIDDSQDDVDLSLRALTRAGLEPQSLRACTPQDLNRALSAQDWDIVLCERQTPQLTAIEVWHLLRGRRLATPFVVFTDLAYNAGMLELLDAGIQYFVDKSRMETLAPVVIRLLGRSGLAAHG